MEETPAAAWVRAAAAGDESAWTCLVERYNAMVWSIARSFRLGTSDASDVVQTTWLRLVEHLHRIDEPARIGSWLATTARHECLAHLRRQGRGAIPVEDLGELADGSDPPGERLLEAVDDALVWAVLEQMPPRCRQLLRLLANDPPPSYQEVSSVLEIPIGSIGPTRARCLERLRRALSTQVRHAERRNGR